MIHYTQPSYLDPFNGETIMSFCPLGERIASTTICVIIAIGAIVAIYTLISVYI